jgi:hypothetical protein
MKPVPFYKLSPKMKNIRMNQWIKTYIGRGLSLEDAQYAARWRAGHWKLSARMEKVLEGIKDV